MDANIHNALSGIKIIPSPMSSVHFEASSDTSQVSFSVLYSQEVPLDVSVTERE